jgi:hypothetical protein
MAWAVRQCCDACLALLVRLPYDLEYGIELLTFIQIGLLGRRVQGSTGLYLSCLAYRLGCQFCAF